ncbi:unnamed protein product [Caretta caretta]
MMSTFENDDASMEQEIKVVEDFEATIADRKENVHFTADLDDFKEMINKVDYDLSSPPIDTDICHLVSSLKPSTSSTDSM